MTFESGLHNAASLSTPVCHPRGGGGRKDWLGEEARSEALTRLQQSDRALDGGEVKRELPLEAQDAR